MTTKPKILCLCDPDGDDGSLRCLRGSYDVVCERSPMRALARLSREAFAGVYVVSRHFQQAARMADHAAFLLDGELVEYAPGKEIFTRPKDKRTEDYVEGRFG